MFDELELLKYFKQIINFKFYYVKYFRVFKKQRCNSGEHLRAMKPPS